MTAFAVYVAATASAEERPRVHAAIAQLKAAGFRVTCTWPDVVGQIGSANPRDASVVERRTWSAQDLIEVDAADALLFLVPPVDIPTRGPWLEAGYAYAHDKHVVFAGDTAQSIFCSLGNETVSDAHAIFVLRELAWPGPVEFGEFR
jgi:nucleoside 2-deoxyribosyltransferase